MKSKKQNFSIRISSLVLILVIMLSMLPVAVNAQTEYPFEEVTLMGTSNDEGKIVFVSMGDGYLSGEQDQFIQDTKSTLIAQLESTYPYSTLFRDKINVHAVKVVSESSAAYASYFGIGDANDAPKAHRLGKAYHPRSHTSVVIAKNYVSGFARVENTNAVAVIGMRYGQEGAIHEVSHSFVRLGDEYNGVSFWEAPNKTFESSADRVKWKGFIGVPEVSGKYTRISDTPQSRTVMGYDNRYVPGNSNLMESAYGYYSIANAAAAVEACARSVGEPFYGTLYEGMEERYTPPGFGIRNTQSEITFPSGFNRIVDFAFHNLTSLKKVSIPQDVSTIGDYAFLRCTALTDIENLSATPQIIPASGAAADPFFGVTRSNVTLRVPKGTTQAYLDAGWHGFNIVEDDDGNAQKPIISMLSDLVVDKDIPASLTVNARVSNGTLSYQWYENSSKTNQGGTAITGATSATLNVPTNTSGRKYYYCAVTNTDTSVPGNKTAQVLSNAVSVTVYEKGESLSITRARVNTWSTSGNDAYGLNHLFDGFEDTYWHSNWGTGSGSTSKSEGLADFDLGSGKTVNAIELDKRYLPNGRGPIKGVRIWIHPEEGGTFPNGETMSSYTEVNVSSAQISSDFSGTGWTEVTGLSVSGLSTSNSPSQTVTVILPEPVDTRYLRVGVTAAEINDNGAGNDYVQVSEVRVFGSGSAAITNAETPSILSYTPDRATEVGETVQIAVIANVSSGELSYQWYEADSRNSSGTAISGATTYVFSPPTSEAGVKYYYCVVTNTDLTATGNQTAKATSPAVSVTVEGTVQEFAIIDINISEDYTFTAQTVGEAQDVKYYFYVTGGGTVHYKELESMDNSFNYTPESSGNYSVRIYAIDNTGRKVFLAKDFTV